MTTFINGDTVDVNPGDDFGQGIIQDGVRWTFSTSGLNNGLFGSLITQLTLGSEMGYTNFS